MKKGKNPLWVLHNNPGSGMNIQKRGNIHDKNYEALANRFGEYYMSEEFANAGKAYQRIDDALDFAKEQGYSGIINIETMPFHSKTLDKNRAMGLAKKSQTLTTYNLLLSEYLKDKPALALSACGTQHSIDTETINNSKWLSYQAAIIDMNTKKCRMKPLSKKGKKVTSALFQDGSKYFILMMGSNNFPKMI